MLVDVGAEHGEANPFLYAEPMRRRSSRKGDFLHKRAILFGISQALEEGHTSLLCLGHEAHEAHIYWPTLQS
jgi:hypothetical protein